MKYHTCSWYNNTSSVIREVLTLDASMVDNHVDGGEAFTRMTQDSVRYCSQFSNNTRFNNGISSILFLALLRALLIIH
jgi:hypothetical protein